MRKPLIGVAIEQSELKRRTRLLNSLIWLLMGTLGIFLVYVLTLGLRSLTASLISLVSALLVSGTGYWLARSGKFYAAVYLFMSGFVILLLVLVFMGGGTSFTISGEGELGWGIVTIAIAVAFLLACMSWLFGESINTACSALRQRSEELQASHKKLELANKELRETQEQLIRSEKLAAIGQLSSGVGHELRNPLGAIKNAIFYIQRRVAKTDLPTVEPRVVEFLGIIDEEVDAANKVITDLLGFSRVAQLTVSPVNIVGEIEDALRHTPQPENIDLVKDINNDLPMVMVDADQIRQVFINIILNAQQAMPDGGYLNIQTRSKDGVVEVDFTDTGCGIPESDINKIFDPLFTTKAKGIGLGLSVCKSILERHGGGIRVESKVGKGTTFTVSLPTQ
jgi:signal transduction histidine kinase